MTVASVQVAVQHYARVREHVRVMARDPEVHAGLTAEELEVLHELEPLWEADETRIDKLRGFGKAMSGTRRSNYTGERAEATRAALGRDLRRLLDGSDASLWVNEPRALGGFGVKEGRRFFNADTLRFFRISSLLDDAEVLWDLSRGARPTVWEIGGGWGGLAHHLKSIRPSVAYLITGTPEWFLVSAVYLMTLFPDAGFRFYDPADPEAFWRDWDRVDFAFAPEGQVPALRPPSLALTVDFETLTRMTPSRIDRHVARAHALGCPYFLSTGASHAGEPESDSPVGAALGRYYWPHTLTAPRYQDRRLVVRGRKAYRLGWRRLHA